jgi:hypothetical protein
MNSTDTGEATVLQPRTQLLEFSPKRDAIDPPGWNTLRE